MRLALAALVAAAACCAGGSGATPAAGPCGLSLGTPKLGEPRFAVPPGGRAVRRPLARRFVLCDLRRRDGSLLARLTSDQEGRFLQVVFYRPSGALETAVSASYAVAQRSRVSCGSSSQASLGSKYWKGSRPWEIGATAPGLDPDAVITAVRNAQSQWTKNTNSCGIKDEANPPVSYLGTTSSAVGHDDESVVDWGSLKNDQTCSQALACAVSWYDDNGSPIESDIRFNTAYEWATNGASDAYDIRSVAAHEIGHVLQFDHVDNAAKGDEEALMWPYTVAGDTSGRKLGRGEAIENNSHY
jgi:hypothetical protein